MKKKQQTLPKDINTRKGMRRQSKAIAAAEKTADDGWERLLKIREKLRKAAASKDEVTDSLAKIGEEIVKGWQSEKSAVEILSEMRR